jgi:glycerol-3-phosphate cytidylyltransferase
MGHIDAKYNAANTRFFILTKVIQEIRLILRNFGCSDELINLSCGLGDISLTSLNDLSRNRTLGLLIGKGFYNPSLENNSVVLEGIRTLKVIDQIISDDLKSKLPLFNFVKNLLAGQELLLDFNKTYHQKYTTVLTYGTFDLFHYGHLEILRRAKELGDRLIVGLSTDNFNNQKGKTCVMPYEKRKEYLESIQYVDMVIPEENWDQKINDVRNFDVDIFVMGDDWQGKFDFLKDFCKVKYYPRTDKISTTLLKSIMKD